MIVSTSIIQIEAENYSEQFINFIQRLNQLGNRIKIAVGKKKSNRSYMLCNHSLFYIFLSISIAPNVMCAH